ncbi:MAG TPA: hypothetical protein VGF76_12040, partial [Polyangiaceae bacterium]
MTDHFTRLYVAGVAGALFALAGSAVVGCSSLSGDAGGGASSGAATAGASSSGGVSNGSAGAGTGNPGGGASGTNGSAGTPGSIQGGGGASGVSGTNGAGANGGGVNDAGASGMGSGGAHGGAGGLSSAGSGGIGATCPTACGASSKCETTTLTCVCNPGFVSQNGACTAAPVGDPSTHTQADVCAQWKAGHIITEPSPLTASGAECDPGTLKPGAITDTLVRINMFRWLEGLGPVSDDPQYDSDAQACANLEAWWDFTSPLSPHMPPATTKCYTTAGGATAGESNVSWGAGGPSQTID